MKGASPLHHESPEEISANEGGQGCEKRPGVMTECMLDTIKHERQQTRKQGKYGTVGAIQIKRVPWGALAHAEASISQGQETAIHHPMTPPQDMKESHRASDFSVKKPRDTTQSIVPRGRQKEM